MAKRPKILTQKVQVYWSMKATKWEAGAGEETMAISRRELFAGAIAGLFSPVLRAADQADQSRMIIRSPRPEDLEMPLDGFTEWITPIDRFFVRCHTYTPSVNLTDWSLK